MKTIGTLCLAAATLVAAVPALDHNSAPQQKSDIVDVAKSAGQFKTLLAAAKAAGLVDALRSDGPLTVLAPTDDAFAALGEETIKNLLQPENKDTLVRILSYHVVSGSVKAADALKAGSAPTLAGPEVSFALEGGRLRINGEVNVVANDVMASNGVIHIIDQVLIPPAEKPEGRLVIGFFSDPPGEELARYLGVDRNACLLVSEVTKGSAAESAGLRAWDLIVALNGRPATSKSVAAVKEEVGYDGTVDIQILRRGEKMTIHSKVGIETH